MGQTSELIICPHCGGEGRKRHSDFIKMMYPLLWFDPIYQCRKCRKMFNAVISSQNQPQDIKKMNPYLKWFLVIAIIFFVAWTILGLVLSL